MSRSGPTQFKPVLFQDYVSIISQLKKRNRLSLEGGKRYVIKYAWFNPQVTYYYGKEKMHTNLLKHMDFYIMPVVNVDGYDYTWKKVGEGKENKTYSFRAYRIHRQNYSQNPGSQHDGFIMKKNLFNSLWESSNIHEQK